MMPYTLDAVFAMCSIYVSRLQLLPKVMPICLDLQYVL